MLEVQPKILCNKLFGFYLTFGLPYLQDKRKPRHAFVKIFTHHFIHRGSLDVAESPRYRN